ncbi:RNA polymerase sigma factor [Saccharophagus degradans]|uniref:RNA polymerase sigma factor n=1 Tax=Saccharophagus degradans TaxID=86304 RepID=UPI0024780E57|nr:RNA polymerase sigma factor [Saccharophagus degradans]WGO97733.1 RNA polymerase sigma factor [Saccharophagus degradans]
MLCARYNTDYENNIAILSMDVAHQQEMIRQAQAGNAAAFESLLDHHYDLIYRFAYKWCGNAAAAEDVAQLVCIKLAKSLAQFRFESAFTSWLYRIVINCAKDWQKAEQRHTHAADEHADVEAEPSANAPNAEHHIYLSQLLSRIDHMGEGFRETALLVHSEGFNHREAADILGVKESTISWRIHEIRKRLTSEDGGQSS